MILSGRLIDIKMLIYLIGDEPGMGKRDIEKLEGLLIHARLKRGSPEDLRMFIRQTTESFLIRNGKLRLLTMLRILENSLRN